MILSAFFGHLHDFQHTLRRSGALQDLAESQSVHFSGASVLIRLYDLPFVDAGGPALRQSNGKAEGGRFHWSKRNLAPLVLGDGIVALSGDGLPLVAVKELDLPRSGQAAFAPASVVEPIGFRRHTP